MIIGLTGPTGAGKSTICSAATEFGFHVINCDEVAHTVTGSGEPLAALVTEFGEKILNSDGTLNRKALSELAFSDKAHTERLNRTVLPYVVEELKRQISALAGKNILLDAPTLYESGADQLCDKVIAVLSNKQNRIERIIKRDNLSTFMALLRISAGKPDEFYREKADILLENNGTESEFLHTAQNLFKEISR